MCSFPAAVEGADTFMAATCGVRHDNTLHRVSYSPSSQSSQCDGIYKHQDEVLDLSPCAGQSNCVLTVFRNKTSSGCALWKLPPTKPNLKPVPVELEQLTLLQSSEKIAFQKVLTHDDRPDRVIVVGNDRIVEMSLEGGGATEELVAVLPDLNVDIATGAWNPNRAQEVALCHGSHFSGFDLRSNVRSFCSPTMAGGVLRDISWNGSQPRCLITGGNDRSVQGWDTRLLRRPLWVLEEAHSHWIWQCRQHREYDRLLLTSSSDTGVKLWSQQLSVPPESHGMDPSERESVAFTLLGSGEEHQDSVYSVAWSMASTFTFASLSYDGRLVVAAVDLQARSTFLQEEQRR
jgi:EARP and GARP complex-interacting protein 1